MKEDTESEESFASFSAVFVLSCKHSNFKLSKFPNLMMLFIEKTFVSIN